MSIDIAVEVQISCPRDEVSAYVVDPTNEPEWINGTKESVPVTPGPTVVVSQARRVAGFMGRRIEYTPEVTEFTPQRHVQMRTDTPFPMTIDYDFVDVASGTRFTQRLRGGPGGLAGLFSPLMALMVRRNIGSDMK